MSDPSRSPAGRARLLGVDPGLRRTGYALLSFDARQQADLLEAGVVRLDHTDRIERRLVELERSIAELIESHHPSVLACEQLYAHYSHPRTAILMSHARGVILMVAARCGMDVVNVGATHAKKMLTGNGHASKTQVQRAVAMTLGLAAPPSPPDVADAIAIGLCGWRLRAARRRATTAEAGVS
ncbi:MAG: crossover junction endodeoxyribonuclease RuvC [Phycisphaerae bacterium]